MSKMAPTTDPTAATEAMIDRLMTRIQEELQPQATLVRRSQANIALRWSLPNGLLELEASVSGDYAFSVRVRPDFERGYMDLTHWLVGRINDPLSENHDKVRVHRGEGDQMRRNGASYKMTALAFDDPLYAGMELAMPPFDPTCTPDTKREDLYDNIITVVRGFIEDRL